MSYHITSKGFYLYPRQVARNGMMLINQRILLVSFGVSVVLLFKGDMLCALSPLTVDSPLCWI